MSDTDDLYVAGYGGNDQLDPSETLTGDDTADPLDAGYTVPDRPPHRWEGNTVDEARRGESLDDHLAEEEPEIDEVARDVGRAGYGISAEEAAMHVIKDEG